MQSASLIHHDTVYNDVRNIYLSVDLSSWNKLEYLEIPSAYSLDLSLLPRTLKYLDITGNHVPLISMAPEGVTLVDLPLLETLLCGEIDLRLDVVLAIIDSSVKAGNLKKLRIVGYSLGYAPVPQPIPTNACLMPSLQELSLSRCQMVEDDIARFLRLCPNLRYLDLSFTRITGVVVKEVMIREIGPLKWLGVNFCTHLSSDAVEWARSLGTVVEYNNNPVKLPAGQRFWRDRLA